MANVLCTLTNPTTRTDGSQLKLTDLKSILLEEQAQGATTWSAVGTPIDPSSLPLVRTVQNVTGGTWNFRASWTTTDNQVSTYASASIAIPFGAANPGTLVLSIV